MVGSDLREGTAVVISSPTASSTAVHQIAGIVLPVAHDAFASGAPCTPINTATV